MVVDRYRLRPLTATSAAAHVSHEAMMSELRQVLDLDEAQMAAIERVFAAHQQTVQHAWEQLRPEVQEAMVRVHDEVTTLLRPEQRERFERWVRERHQARPH
jgi:hypothetical protein